MKLQIALEFVIMLAFITVVFIFLFDVIATQTSLVINQQDFSQLQLIAQNIAQQINVAASAGNGYYANVPLVGTVAVPVYSVNITKNGVLTVGTQIGLQTTYATVYTNARNILFQGPVISNSLSANYIAIQNYYGAICIDYSCPQNQTQVARFGGSAGAGIISTGVTLIPNTATQFSVSLWVNPTASSLTSEGILAGENTGVAVTGYGVFALDDGSGIVYCGHVGYSNVNSGANTLTPGTWYNLICTWSSTAATLYLNGRVVGTSTFTLGYPNLPFTMGAATGLSDFFNGSIANVQVYSTALSSTQASQLYQGGIASSPVSNAILAGWWPLNGNANDYSGNKNSGVVQNAYFEPALQASLVGWWPLSQNYGSKAYDLSGYNNTGFLTNTAWSYPQYVGNFNGTSGYISVANNANLHFSGPFTVSAWVYIPASQVYNAMSADPMIIGDYNGEWEGYKLSIISGRIPYFEVGRLSDHTVSGVYQPSEPLALNTWYYIVGVYNGTGPSIFVNGVKVAGATYSPIQAEVSGTTIGKAQWYSSYFNGSVANIQLYNAALTNNQVYSQYKAGISGAPIGGVGNVAWWPLNGDAKDYSGYNDNGVTNGGAYFAQPNLALTNPNTTTFSAGVFNGVNSYVSTGTNGLPLGSAPRSAFAWIWIADSAEHNVFTYGSQATSGWVALEILASGGGLTFNEYSYAFTSALVPTIGAWHFVGYTYSGGTSVTLYLDGQSQTGTINTLNTVLGSDPSDIGKISNNYPGPYWFKGLISNVQIYNTSLSASQTKQLYNEGIQGPPVPGAGLVSWWPLTGSAADYGLRGNNGAATNVIYGSYSLPQPGLLQGSLAGSGANFNGANSLMNLKQPQNDEPTNAMTLFAWIKPASTAVGTIISRNGPFYLAFGNSQIGGSDCVGGGVYTGVWTWLCGNTKIPINTWSQVAVTYNGAKEVVYLNGIANGAVSVPGSTCGGLCPTGSVLWIGWGDPGYNQYFNGSIANVQMYDTALSPLQIYALYKGAILSPNTPSGNKAIYTVPIELTNSQTSATGGDFQQMLTVNSLAYQNYITPGWTNVEFTTGPQATGAVLQAWVESNATNTAKNTIVWVNVSGGIQASSSIVIYMNIMANPVMSAQGPTGEAPQLSLIYGQNDNGAGVFNFYDDFAGSSLNPRWSSVGSFSVNNGLTLTLGEGEYAAIAPNAAGMILESNYKVGVVSTDTDYEIGLGFGGVTSGFQTSGYSGYNFGSASDNVQGELKYLGGQNVVSSSTTPTPTSGITYKSTFQWAGSTQTGTLTTPTNVYSSSGSDSTYTLGQVTTIYLMQYGIGSPSTTTYWIRARAYPPNGVMPTTTFIASS